MNKRILYYLDSKGRNPVLEYLKKLPPGEYDKCFEYIDILSEEGESIRRPVGDYLGGKLYELRPKQNRILYFFFFRDAAVLLHAFRKKTDAIPAREIKIAMTRMNDFIQCHQGEKI